MTQNGPGVSAADIVALRAESKTLPILLTGVLDAKIEEFKAAEEKAAAATSTAAQQVADAKDAAAQVESDRAKLTAAQEAFDSAQQVAAGNAASLKSSLDARARVVAGQEAALREGQAKLKDDQQAFNARLEALKAAV